MKPTLYLHCGIYKTGSSFLQTMFVRNRELLSKRGIHYPKSEQELEMFNGEITAGNGIHLSDTLPQSETEIIKLLSVDLIESKRMNLNAVLYSSEILFHRFNEEGTIQKLQNAAKAAGFGDIQALIYFRDPVSHALSTYKHRAKYGDHQDFSRWLEKKYEIFELIQAFLEYSNSSQIRWTCRKYHSDSVYMVNTSFVDWLKTEAPEIPQDDRVNRSLQLNEIRVLQCLKINYPGSENFLRETLLSQQAEGKASDKGLKDLYSYLVAEEWCAYKTMLDSLNLLLNEDEKLKLDSFNKPDDYGPFIALSEKQMQAVAEGMANYLRSQKLLYRLKNFWKRGLKKVRRKLVSSKISYKF